MRQKFTFQTDEDIAVFMEQHDGFELVDQGLAEIIATPQFYKKEQIELDKETLYLLEELVATGVCMDMREAIALAVHSYVLAVLPQQYKLRREGVAMA